MAISQNPILPKCHSPKSLLLLHFSMNLSETFRINVNMDFAHTERGRFFIEASKKILSLKSKNSLLPYLWFLWVASSRFKRPSNSSTAPESRCISVFPPFKNRVWIDRSLSSNGWCIRNREHQLCNFTFKSIHALYGFCNSWNAVPHPWTFHAKRIFIQGLIG